MVATVLQLRRDLLAAGHDAGPQTILHHVAGRLAQPAPSRSTVWRILYDPQTCGKVERLHQSLKRFLVRRPPASCIADLQAQLDAFRRYYNQLRPHRALDGRTPAQAFAARIKAGPAAEPASVQYRVRRDRIDKTGTVTLRYRSRLRHIRIGAAHRNKPGLLFVAGAEVRVVTEDGELLRTLTIAPTRDYQPLNGRWPVHNVLRQASSMS